MACHPLGCLDIWGRWGCKRFIARKSTEELTASRGDFGNFQNHFKIFAQKCWGHRRLNNLTFTIIANMKEHLLQPTAKNTWNEHHIYLLISRQLLSNISAPNPSNSAHWAIRPKPFWRSFLRFHWIHQNLCSYPFYKSTKLINYHSLFMVKIVLSLFYDSTLSPIMIDHFYAI